MRPSNKIEEDSVPPNTILLPEGFDPLVAYSYIKRGLEETLKSQANVLAASTHVITQTLGAIPSAKLEQLQAQTELSKKYAVWREEIIELIGETRGTGV